MPATGNAGISPGTTGEGTTITVGVTYLNGDVPGGTDSSGTRGLALLNAAALQTSGEQLLLGPGWFNIGSVSGGNQLAIPLGVSMIGAGPGELITPGTTIASFTPLGGTVISYTRTATTSFAAVLPEGSNVVQELTIYSASAYNGTCPPPIGFGTGDVGGTNVLLQDVQIIGQINGVAFINQLGNTPVAYWTLQDCTLATAQSVISIQSGVGDPFTALTLDIRRCNIMNMYNGANGGVGNLILCQGTQEGAGVITINAWNTSFEGRFLSTSAYAIESGAATVNLYTGNVRGYSTSNTTYYTPLKSDASNGNINVGPGFTVIHPELCVTSNGGTITGLAPEIFGTGTPTATSNTANGTSGTASLTSGSTDAAGTITITPGGTGIAAGVVATVAFAGKKLNGFASLTPGNAAAATAMTTNLVFASTSSAGVNFTINTSTVALTTATPYIFNYTCPGP